MDAIFGLNLAVAVAVRWVHGSIAGNQFFFANRGTIAIDYGAAHEYELLDASIFRLLSAFHCQVGVHRVIEFCALVADLAVIAVGDSRHMINRIVLAKIKATPSVANHVKRIDLVLAGKFGLCEIVRKGGADVAVRACD